MVDQLQTQVGLVHPLGNLTMVAFVHQQVTAKTAQQPLRCASPFLVVFTTYLKQFPNEHQLAHGDLQFSAHNRTHSLQRTVHIGG